MNIKKILFGAVAVLVTVGMISCGGNKTGGGQQTAAENPFGETFETPCMEHDDDLWFAATGIANGPRTEMGEIQRIALANAQDMVRQKMQHAYKGMVTNYMTSVSGGEGADIGHKLEAGGNQIIDAIVNNTRATCGPKFSSPDAQGNVNCFIGIRISKGETADKILNGVSEDEDMRLILRENNFQEKMRREFEAFR